MDPRIAADLACRRAARRSRRGDGRGQQLAPVWQAGGGSGGGTGSGAGWVSDGVATTGSGVLGASVAGAGSTAAPAPTASGDADVDVDDSPDDPVPPGARDAPPATAPDGAATVPGELAVPGGGAPPAGGTPMVADGESREGIVAVEPASPPVLAPFDAALPVDAGAVAARTTMSPNIAPTLSTAETRRLVSAG